MSTRSADEVWDWLSAPLAAVFGNAGVAVAATVLDGLPEDDDWLHGINFRGVVNYAVLSRLLERIRSR